MTWQYPGFNKSLISTRAWQWHTWSIKLHTFYNSIIAQQIQLFFSKRGRAVAVCSSLKISLIRVFDAHTDTHRPADQYQSLNFLTHPHLIVTYSYLTPTDKIFSFFQHRDVQLLLITAKWTYNVIDQSLSPQLDQIQTYLAARSICLIMRVYAAFTECCIICSFCLKADVIKPRPRCQSRFFTLSHVSCQWQISILSLFVPVFIMNSMIWHTPTVTLIPPVTPR